MTENGELRFIRANDLRMIPRYLLEQVKDREWQVDEVYAAWPLFDNQLNLLYALADQDYQVRGVLWLSIIPLQRLLFINLLSLDRGWQGKGFMRRQFHPFMRKLKEQLGLKFYKGITSRPRAFGRLGFKPDPQVLVTEG